MPETEVEVMARQLAALQRWLSDLIAENRELRRRLDQRDVEAPMLEQESRLLA